MQIKVAVIPEGHAAEQALREWGWEVTAAVDADVVIGMTQDCDEADEFVLWPVERPEMEVRIANAQRRRAAMRRWNHDARSPLNAIRGYAELLLETGEGDVARYAANIKKASEQMEEILNRLCRRSV